MINFKKNSIFSRDAKEESVKEEILHGGVLAVWGSPGSGKTTTAVKLAKYLADKNKNVVLVPFVLIKLSQAILSLLRSQFTHQILFLCNPTPVVARMACGTPVEIV